MELLDRDGRSLHALLWRLTGSTEAAEDLLQELVVRLAGAAGLDHADRPGSYARQVATNLALDWRRGEKRRAKLHRGAGDSRRRVEPAEAGPAERLLARERVEEMLDAMAELRPQDREVLRMRYLDEMDYDAMGQRLGKTGHQSRGLCAGAMRRLRAKMNPRAVETGPLAIDPAGGEA